MATYLLAYHGGSMPESKAEQAKVQELWGAWMKQLGTGLVDGGNPTGQAKTVAKDGKVSDGGGVNPVSGYSVIKVDSFENALAAAKMCPILAGGGSIEICETVEVM
ncbi:MAG: hypothetical protein WCH13_17955 [Deltaproteobacteria bacterium]